MRVIPADFALTGEGMDYLTRWEPSDDTLALEVLGHPLRPTAETLADTVRWLCASGPPPRQVRPRPRRLMATVRTRGSGVPLVGRGDRRVRSRP